MIVCACRERERRSLSLSCDGHPPKTPTGHRECSSSDRFRKRKDTIKRILTSGLKYELNVLANKDFQDLTKSYLPGKLKEKDWLKDTQD